MLKIHEKALGPDHPDAALSLRNLAYLYYVQQKYADAEPLTDRAIAIWDRAGVAPGTRYLGYLLRAHLSWKLNRVLPASLHDRFGRAC